MQFRSVYITAGDEAEAQKISRTLVQERLAACANYFPTKSVFWWKGAIEETPEFSLIMKTRAELVPQVIARVKQIHSYTIPCVVSWIIEDSNPEFLDWIRESTERASE
jgi:periplasmic divalent cation tolerance protein